MDIKKLIDTLHPLERKVLPVLDKISDFSGIVSETKLKEVEVMRALQWLQNKGVVKLKEELKEVVDLGKNGKRYLKEGLPERKFLNKISSGDWFGLDQISKQLNLDKQEINACLGSLRKKAALEIKKENGVLFVRLTDAGKRLLEKRSLEEEFLKKKFLVEIKTLKEEERFAFESLRKRKDMLKTRLLKLKRVELTELGKKAIKAGVGGRFEERLTPEMLKNGTWKGKRFRRFDVSINVPAIFGGRKQHYRRFLDEMRVKFLSLGFIECDGPIVETDFYNMDALYMPQFHSARDIHQAYYVKEPEYSKLDEKLVQRVKQAHENGFKTGSKGWGYEFDVKRTHRNLLRTHDTAICARTLSSKELKIPGKYFQISRCFRPDVIDTSHNVDFNQVGGFVLEEGLNLRHLFGLLQMFAKEFAETDEIRLVPGYFPFTEPSVELWAKHPELGWLELGGAGIFRPEMTRPLGIRMSVPVLAWGLGIDRLAMFKLGIKDIRQLFSHDLEFLRKVRIV